MERRSNENTFLTNLTQFQFSSLNQHIHRLISNDDHTKHGYIRLQQRQFQNSQQIYYCPTQEALTRTDIPSSRYEELVKIPLNDGERVLYATRPPIQFYKNIIILFFAAFAVVTLMFCVPMYYILCTIVRMNIGFGWKDSEGYQDVSFISNSILYMFILIYLFIVVYMLCYRLLYRKLSTVYVITNERAIIIEGIHKFEQFLLYIKRRIARLNPYCTQLISSYDKGTSDGYSCLSMRQRYNNQVTYIDSDIEDELESNTSANSSSDINGSNDNSVQLQISNSDTESEQKGTNSSHIEKVNISDYVTSWKFSEMGDLFFTLYHGLGKSNLTNSDGESASVETDLHALGGVYFGYKIDSYTLPFSIVTYAFATGFILVSDVYLVLDILIQQCLLSGSTHAMPQARLVKSKHDPAIRSHVIFRTYACCGLEICYCCPYQDSGFGSSRKKGIKGKITEEDFRNLTMSYSVL
jgi:hypothetical protein